jgi:thiosulfate/3-mercaptopyruvate sulfurtransferase
MHSPLISPEELSGLEGGVVVLDARPGQADYDAGHLRGATRADLETHLSAARAPGANPARGGRHPLPDPQRFAKLLGDWGIGPSTQVVVYDDQFGANAAARAWWMLRALGHEQVAVLDGGFRAAVAAGLEVTMDVPVPVAREPYPAAGWTLPTVDMQRVDELRRDDGWKVLDVRSAERYRGETEPIDPVAGRIPGAVNLPFADNLANGRFKSAAELRAQYERLLDGTPADHLVVHCGSGVTACHTLLALEAAGLEGAALYVGSWGEWCRNPMSRAGS